jgi:endonuclease-8
VPEGHTVHRQARQILTMFAERPMTVTSPQGRFAAGAALLDGRTLAGAQAHGKHLFVHFAPDDLWLHVHLGLFGTWTFGTGLLPEPRGAVRVRLGDGRGWAELRGPTACEVLTPAEVGAIRARLGADPLRADADDAAAGRRVRTSRAPVGALLMQQEVVAGVGNVYRAEVLFRARLDPWLPGRAIDELTWTLLWRDLVLLLRDGVRRGRIITTLREDRDRRGGAIRREDAHYVYKRAGLPCRICGTPVLAEPMVARTLYRCAVCQREPSQPG